MIDQGFSYEIVSQSQLKLTANLLMSKTEEQEKFAEYLLTNIKEDKRFEKEDWDSSTSSDESDGTEETDNEEELEYENTNPLNNNMVFIHKKNF